MTDDHDGHETEYDAEYVAAWREWTLDQERLRFVKEWHEKHGAFIVPDDHFEDPRYPTSNVTGLWTQEDWDNWYQTISIATKRGDPLRLKPT